MNFGPVWCATTPNDLTFFMKLFIDISTPVITYEYFSIVGSMIAKNELSKQIIIGESVSSDM